MGDRETIEVLCRLQDLYKRCLLDSKDEEDIQKFRELGEDIQLQLNHLYVN